jgi:hypothetical protein
MPVKGVPFTTMYMHYFGALAITNEVTKKTSTFKKKLIVDLEYIDIFPDFTLIKHTLVMFI